MSKVFISYSHSDKLIADEIAVVLEELNIEFFLDEKNIDWGDKITAKVREGLNKATAIIVIVSPGSQKSQWVAFEVGFGAGTGKRILPFLTHPKIDVPGFISDLLHVSSISEIREFFVSNTTWHELKNADEPESGTKTATLTDMQVEYFKDISKPINKGSIHGGIDNETGRDVLKYQDALELFQSLELMSYTGDSYKMTTKGWQLADQLWALAILDVLEFDKYVDDKIIAEKVGLTDGQSELEELNRHLDSLERDDLVKLARTMHDLSVSLTPKGATVRKHRAINLK